MEPGPWTGTQVRPGHDWFRAAVSETDARVCSRSQLSGANGFSRQLAKSPGTFTVNDAKRLVAPIDAAQRSMPHAWLELEVVERTEFSAAGSLSTCLLGKKQVARARLFLGLTGAWKS